MADKAVKPLILDLLEWLAKSDRTYEEVMQAWRTSCPKLPVWEEANDQGLVTIDNANERRIVRITQLGGEFLRNHIRPQRPKYNENNR